MIENVRIINTQILSNDYYLLRKITYEYEKKDGSTVKQTREVYQRGTDGAAILLYNTEKKTVILTRQFRLPTFVNGNPPGMLVEVCAGLLGNETPEECIIRETEEETGYRLPSVKKVFEAYTSPGVMTELLYLYVAEYNDSMKVNKGGGLQDEEENIEVLEMPFDEAVRMMNTFEIRDAKTIMLLQYCKLQGLL
jgi:GDP-mannose pyrophosphatase NudK